MGLIRNRKASVFIIVVLIALILVIIGGALSNMVLQDVHITRHLRYTIQAGYIAESGANVALAALWGASGGLYQFTKTDTLGAGSYQASVAKIGSRWLVSSTGTVNNISRTVTVEVCDTYPPALDYSLAVGTNVVIKSNKGDVTIRGDIHANNNMTLQEIGPSTLLHVSAYGAKDGNATASGTYDGDKGNVQVDGSELPGQPKLPQPVFNFSYFKDVAQNQGGTYYSSGQTFTDNMNINGGSAGIVYVDGDATFVGTCRIIGGFVAKGDITLNAGNTLTQVHDAGNRFPIFMSKEGNRIKLYGRFNTEEGNVVYATNKIQIETPSGNPAVVGCVIAGGDFDITANAPMTITYDKISAPEVVPSGFKIVSWNR